MQLVYRYSAVLEASEARALAARDLARDLDGLEAEIVSLRKENYQLRTAAGGEEVVRLDEGEGEDDEEGQGGRGGASREYDAAADDQHSADHSVGLCTLN
jgi:hypothetical protein